MPLGFQQEAAGDYDAAFATASAVVEIAERFRDADLLAATMHFQGLVRIKQGRVDEGLRLLDEAMVARGRDRVRETDDPTAHAVVMALREAARKVGRDRLRDVTIFSTVEPCPMCMAALHWARVDTVYYGASIADAATAGFNELQLPAAELLHIGKSRLKLIPGVLTEECKQLFVEWNANPNKKVY